MLDLNGQIIRRRKTKHIDWVMRSVEFFHMEEKQLLLDSRCTNLAIARQIR